MKSWGGRLKATTREGANFISVTSLRDKSLTVPNITAQLNQCREKNVKNLRAEEILWS